MNVNVFTSYKRVIIINYPFQSDVKKFSRLTREMASCETCGSELKKSGRQRKFRSEKCKNSFHHDERKRNAEEENREMVRWQESIIAFSEEQYSYKFLCRHGVVLCEQAVGEDEYTILLEYFEGLQAPVSSISGGQKMINMLLEAIEADARLLLAGVQSFVQKFCPSGWKFADHVSFLSNSVNGQVLPISRQVLHTDSYNSASLQVLLVLSETGTPTDFAHRTIAEMRLKSFKKRLTDVNKLTDAEIDELKPIAMKRCKEIFMPIEEADSRIYPVSNQKLQRGDMVLFLGDSVHRPKDESGENRSLLFMAASKYETDYKMDLQFHATQWAITLQMNVTALINKVNDPESFPSLKAFLVNKRNK